MFYSYSYKEVSVRGKIPVLDIPCLPCDRFSMDLVSEALQGEGEIRIPLSLTSD